MELTISGGSESSCECSSYRAVELSSVNCRCNLIIFYSYIIVIYACINSNIEIEFIPRTFCNIRLYVCCIYCFTRVHSMYLGRGSSTYSNHFSASNVEITKIFSIQFAWKVPWYIYLCCKFHCKHHCIFQYF